MFLALIFLFVNLFSLGLIYGIYGRKQSYRWHRRLYDLKVEN